MTEEQLDANGVLRNGAVFQPPESALLVFAQRRDARVELASWRQQAERFFDTTLGLTVSKRYETDFPAVDFARVVVAKSAIAGGTRSAWSRPADETDWSRAEAAERASRMGGMGALARRCKQVWLIERESDDDKTALLVAAILASVLLGPIVIGEQIFGVRGARERLEDSGARDSTEGR